MLDKLGLEIVLVDKRTKKIVRKFRRVYREKATREKRERYFYYYTVPNKKKKAKKYLTAAQLKKCKEGKLRSFRGGACGRGRREG
jgi:hypothetical protein